MSAITVTNWRKVKAKRNSFGVRTIEYSEENGEPAATYEVQPRRNGAIDWPSRRGEQWFCSCRTVMLGGTCEAISHATWYRTQFEAQA